MQDPGSPSAPCDHGLTASVLVLNRHYAAIRIVPARRAFALLCKESAEAIDHDDGEYLAFNLGRWLYHSSIRLTQLRDHEQFVRTPSHAVMVPRIIRLVRYDKIPRRSVKFNRKNVLARDENRCQYCGKRLPPSRLSIDHVVPRSRGGRSGWNNVVAACRKCNTRKGGKLVGEASMRLLRPPRAPKSSPLLRRKLESDRYSIWRHFLRDGDCAVDAG